mgnify:FL=1
MNIQAIFNFFEVFLPEKSEVKSVSIYPLPYPGYFEVYVECKDGKRYRALADKDEIVSDFVEFDLGVKNGSK